MKNLNFANRPVVRVGAGAVATNPQDPTKLAPKLLQRRREIKKFIPKMAVKKWPAIRKWMYNEATPLPHPGTQY